MELSQYFATWHPVFVHFPIGLLFVAVALDFYGYFRKDERALWAGNAVLIFGTVGILFTFITGNFAEIWAARSLIPQDPLKRHEAFATICSWAFIALVAVRSFLQTRPNKNLFRAYLIGACGALFALYLTGAQGGRLVYQYAAGVQGVEPPYRATGLELANLSLLNTPDELAYSEMMHHIFGVLVFGLAIWLTYQMLELPGVERVRAMGPILLSAGGLFLMIFSDFDAWPLSNEKPITDPEVLAHKIIATMMIVIGLGTNLVRKRKGADVSSLQAHLVAVLALAGGGILMTHVHTGAPYSETAVGVYLHHFALGILALLCGAVKLLELSLPQRMRVWNVAWVILLFLVSGALITYNEGIPWFMRFLS
ncbi:MAG: hypothetical protein KC800_10450 [Candidatus Eremiobacteraeota bacterium]|nr:hypothetical protein [Candidatus Eremiobacteraeota bacterium]